MKQAKSKNKATKDRVETTEIKQNDKVTETKADDIVAVGRLMNGERVIGLVLRHRGELKRVLTKDVMRLARDGAISNIGTRVNNGTPYIHGIGIKIEELRTYKI